MKYRRMPIEVESPEQLGYDTIACNLAESSVSDMRFSGLDIRLGDMPLCYGDHVGKPELRELIAAQYKGLRADDVLLTAGAAPALFITATSLLSRNHHLAVMFPNYATNIETPFAIGCAISRIELRFDEQFRLDISQVEKLIRPKTKYISITYPHNPTGAMINREELDRLVRLAEKKKIYLLVDETYRELNRAEEIPLAASLSSRVISVSSLSKAYGLPGIRMGWLITKDNVLKEKFLAAKEQIFVCNSVVDEEIAYRFMLKKEKFIPHIQKTVTANFNLLEKWMKEQDMMEWVRPVGGVVCFPRIKTGKGVNVPRFYTLLNKKYRTYVGPGHWFGMNDRYMRIGYGWPGEREFKKGLENISRALREAGGGV